MEEWGKDIKWEGEGGGTCSRSAKYSLEVFRITIRIIFIVHCVTHVH